MAESTPRLSRYLDHRTLRRQDLREEQDAGEDERRAEGVQRTRPRRISVVKNAHDETPRQQHQSDDVQHVPAVSHVGPKILPDLAELREDRRLQKTPLQPSVFVVVFVDVFFFLPSLIFVYFFFVYFRVLAIRLL